MDDVKHSPTENLPRPPGYFIVLSIVFFLLGAGVTPDLMVFLGPMRQSLTSGITSVRTVAHIEVLLFRIGCVVLGMLLALSVARWKQLVNSSFVSRIRSVTIPTETAGFDMAAVFSQKAWLILIACIVAGMAYVGFWAQFLNDEQLMLVNDEDGIIEYASSILLLGASVFSAVLSFRFPDHKGRRIVHRVFALAFFAMAGEEISWGQRIFGVAPAGVFQEINVQGETNLHNLFGYFADHLFIAGVLVYGFVLPVLRETNLFCRKLFHFIGLPLPSVGLAIGFLLVSMLHDWTVYRVFDPLPTLRIAELREFLSALGFALVMYESRKPLC